MSLTQRFDYVAQAQARLPRFFRDKPRLFAVLAAFAEGAEDFESYAFGMYAPRFLANAAGATLDLYGAIVGQARLGMDDASYRLRIRARMALNRSSGTVPDLIRIAQLLVPDNTVTLRESYPAALLMQIADGPTPLLEDVYQILYSAKAAGVSFRLTTQDATDAERFVFEGGVGLGFGGYATDWVGAPLQTQQGLTGKSLGPVETIDSSGTASPPTFHFTGGAVPSELGLIVIVLLDDVTYSWEASNGMGNNDANIGGPGGFEMVDANLGYGPIGIQAVFDGVNSYTTDDSYQFTVDDGGIPVDSTAPVVTATGSLTAAATGKWTFRIITGTPNYWFNYTRPDGTLGATQAMNRGTPVVLRDAALNPVGLSVTWPNVTAYYTDARHTVRVHRASSATGGHWVDVR